MTRPTRALLNWSHLRHNFDIARQHVDGMAYAVIKANGYGHGALECARALANADGFCVACVDEAMELRQGGINQPIVVLQGAYDASEWELASQHNIQLALHHQHQLQDRAQAKLSAPVGVWLKINSGMNRLGFRISEADSILAQIAADPLLKLGCIISHFATADDLNTDAFAQQLEYLTSRQWPVPLCLSNSAGLLSERSVAGQHIPDFISRPGIMLYGSSPLNYKSASDLNLKAVMTLASQLISTHDMAIGERLGYGGDFVADKPTRVGVVAIGYGDGYPRHAKQGTPVLVDGVECPLIGRVAMDMITVDISHLPSAQVGSYVELWGENLSVDRIAASSGTISYELFCQLTPRVKRVSK